MKPELEEVLIKIDPIFFQERVACINGDMNEMNSCMAFGCECGDGWFEPLKKMTTQISFLNRAGIRDNVEIICEQLRIFSPETVIERLTGDGAKSTLIAPIWTLNKRNVLNSIDKRLSQLDAWQGDRFEG